MSHERAAPPADPALTIVHLVVTENFAGVERYVTYVAPVLAARGHNVTVLGGDARRMNDGLGSSVRWRGVWSLPAAVRMLFAHRRADVIHVHMTAAEIAATMVRPFLRGTVISTRHFAARRGSSTAIRLLNPLIRRSIDEQISISQFVADSIGEPSTVILNAVPEMPVGPHDQAVVLVVQRLEVEKQTAVALRAWALSGLGVEGWTMEIAGDGVERPALERLAAELGVSKSVRFLGFADDVAARMSRARILLATAPAEPFGLAVAEALAAGMVVVAADGGGHRETVGRVSPELLFPVGDHAAAARALRTAMSAERPGVAGASLDDHVVCLERLMVQRRRRARRFAAARSSIRARKASNL
jgi:glycosyltransferase involved in cell wall biosynthesis